MHPRLRAFWREVQIASPGQNATGSGTSQLHILSQGDPEMTSQNNHGSTLLHWERRGQPEMVVSHVLYSAVRMWPTAWDNFGYTLLYLALNLTHTGLICVLLEGFVDVMA